MFIKICMEAFCHTWKNYLQRSKNIRKVKFNILWIVRGKKSGKSGSYKHRSKRVRGRLNEGNLRFGGDVQNGWHVLRKRDVGKRAIKSTTIGAVGWNGKTETGKGWDRKEEDHLSTGRSIVRGSRGRGWAGVRHWARDRRVESTWSTGKVWGGV